MLGQLTGYQGNQQRGHAPHQQLRPEASMQEGQACEYSVDETGTGPAWDVQRAREQSSGVA